MRDILAVLEQRRLRSIKKSIQYEEQREVAAQHHSAVAKVIVSGKSNDVGLSIEVQTLRSLYYDMLQDYQGNTYGIAGPITKRGAALWTRVANAWKCAECTPTQFMRAQFAWFHKAFGKAPKVKQLTTDSAINRAREFTGNADRRIIGNNVSSKIDLAAVFRESEKLLQDMMRAQNCSSREDFYRDFVLSGLVTFPKAFLNADPSYRKVTNDR
jgi:hypothetical protein